MYNIKIFEEACKSIIELADNVSNDRVERSMIYHLLKFIRAAVRDFSNNSDKSMVDLLNAYAAKIKKSAGGKIARYVIAERSDERKKGEIIPMPIMNAHCSFIGLLKRALRENDVENYTRIHKIENLYTHKFFEYSDWVDTHPEIENQYIKSTMLMALCSELGRYGGYLKHEMKNAGLECDEIIV